MSSRPHSHDGKEGPDQDTNVLSGKSPKKGPADSVHPGILLSFELEGRAGATMKMATRMIGENREAYPTKNGR
jgi:hypothetical protein